MQIAAAALSSRPLLGAALFGVGSVAVQVSIDVCDFIVGELNLGHLPMSRADALPHFDLEALSRVVAEDGPQIWGALERALQPGGHGVATTAVLFQ